MRLHRPETLIALLVLASCGCAATQTDAPPDAGPIDAPRVGGLEVGTHGEHEGRPGTFTALSEGSEARVVLGGGNGAWMLVTASRADRALPGVATVTVRVAITDAVDGREWADATWKRRALLGGEDTAAYLPGQFVVLPDDFGWEGRTVDVAVTWLTEEASPGRLEGSVRVTLTRAVAERTGR